MSTHPDPRARRRPGGFAPAGFAPPVDALAAAVRLEVAADAMRAEQLERGSDEPPTGLIDLAAIRAAVAAGPISEPVNPATAAWLAGASAADALAAGRLVDAVEQLPSPRAPERLGRSVEEIMAEIEASVVAASEAAGGEDWTQPAPVAPVAPADGEPAPARPFDSEHPRLNWRPGGHDPASLAFGVRAQLARPVPLADHLWFPGVPLDQGSEGACVGFGITDALNAAAAGDRDRGAEDARGLYRLAQRLDQYPGEAYSGTSVLGGMKAAQRSGWISGYRWCFGTRDIAQAVMQCGPVVVGVPWLEGMYTTGPGGLVQLEGPEIGGHCLAVVGIRLAGPAGQPGPFFVWQNSWGPEYGDGGLGYVHHRDLARLLAGVGEAALPTVAR